MEWDGHITSTFFTCSNLMVIEVPSGTSDKKEYRENWHGPYTMITSTYRKISGKVNKDIS